ncbi:MAG TPA: hypothetical protein VMH02_10940, partial [Verrucomicrobiae bacterium]|nr:hypothetical protein [Verrucomicrobiae bacterium]
DAIQPRLDAGEACFDAREAHLDVVESGLDTIEPQFDAVEARVHAIEADFEKGAEIDELIEDLLHERFRAVHGPNRGVRL